ncbi:MAG TPA: hypothetical protein VGL53_15000 [Bryobacteraceae bacterium]|jgi:hypothetical protein
MRTSIRTDERRGAGERGFALLVVFLVAAGILIALYMEIPRVAFESQRHLEQNLIDRGEQYSRAVEVFYRKNKRYPAKIEELESFNNMRFLRRRYLDPMTGKDDWRLLHMGPNGQISDSLIPKANGLNGASGASGATGASGQTATTDSNFGTPINGDQNATVAGQTGGTGDINVAMTRIRPSDGRGRMQPGASVGNGQQAVDANGNPISDPNAVANNNPGFTPVGQPGGYNQPGQPGYNPSLPPSYPNQTGINPGGVQPNNGGQIIGQNLPNYGASGQTGQDPTQSGNPALNAINNQLRNPGSAFGGSGFGASGSTGATGALPTTQTAGGQTFGGGGIAGVASVQSGIGIKVYNDRKKYKEWEFVYDYTKAKTTIPVPGNPMGASGSTGGTSTSGFGSSGFGSSSTTTPPPQPPNQPPPNQGTPQ